MRTNTSSKSPKLLLSMLFTLLVPTGLTFGEDVNSLKKTANPKPADQTVAQKIAKTKTELDSVVAKSRKCNQNRDCTALPIGEKTCGGPERYVIYSRQSPQSAEISPLAATYLSQRKAQNSESIDMTDCEFIAAPKVVCSSKKSCEASSR